MEAKTKVAKPLMHLTIADDPVEEQTHPQPLMPNSATEETIRGAADLEADEATMGADAASIESR